MHKRLLIVGLIVVALVGSVWSLSRAEPAAVPPLVPFNLTDALYVLENRSDSIVRIDTDGSISTAVTANAITTATGAGSVDFRQGGLAVDATGSLYFIDGVSRSVLKSSPAGAVTLLASESTITAATGAGSADPDGLGFGSDGMLYVNDDASDSVLRIDPGTGATTVYVTEQTIDDVPTVTTVELESGIIGAEGGVLYVASDGTPDAVFEITASDSVSLLASSNNGAPFSTMLEGYLTRDATGRLYITDLGGSTVFSISPANGAVTEFLSTQTISDTAAPGSSGPNLQGGIAFDSAGRFYLAEEETDTILRFENQGGTWQGTVWVTEAELAAATGAFDATLDGGIAFAPGIAVRVYLPIVNK